MFPDEEKHNNLALVVAPSPTVVSLVSATEADGAPAGGAQTTLERGGSGPAPIRALLWMHAALLDPGIMVTHSLAGPMQMWDQTRRRKGYVHVVQRAGYNPGESAGGTLRISPKGGVGAELHEGDGAYLMYEKDAVLELANVGDSVVEVLVFDLE